MLFLCDEYTCIIQFQSLCGEVSSGEIPSGLSGAQREVRKADDGEPLVCC